MKKRFCILMILAVFMLAGCALGTSNIAYAPSAPPEKLCTLRIVPTLTVTEFDGAPVNWNGGFGSWGEVKIPEGTHTFILTYSAAHGYQRGLSFTASFAAGRTYSMVTQPISQTTVRIGIVDGAL